MKIAVDIDGVICNLVELVTKIAAKEKNTEIIFNKYEAKIIGSDNNSGIFGTIIDDIFTNRMDQLRPYPKNQYWLCGLYLLGPITFITARNTKYNFDTRNWLLNNVPFSDRKSVV